MTNEKSDFSETCSQCQKQFNSKTAFDIHCKFHESLGNATRASVSSSAPSTPVITAAPTFTSPVKKVGLTRVKMEDCPRCDECSCIYLNEDDYHKHMKNFHRRNSPRKNRQRKSCWSCCKNCNCKDFFATIQKERGNNNLFHYNIKDRWSKISTRLQQNQPPVKIKTEPCVTIKKENDEGENSQQYPDLSHLLSQVVVKIKTEPPEEMEY